MQIAHFVQPLPSTTSQPSLITVFGGWLSMYYQIPDRDLVMVMDQDEPKTKQELCLDRPCSPIMNPSMLLESIPSRWIGNDGF